MTYIVDQDIIDQLKLKKADSLFLTQMEQLKGSYTSFPDFKHKVLEIFGKNPWDYIRSNISDFSQLRKKEFRGQVVSYLANGYLGNYIVVIPEKNIVAIRMISHQSFNHDDPTGKDGFSDFKEVMKNLVTEHK